MPYRLEPVKFRDSSNVLSIGLDVGASLPSSSHERNYFIHISIMMHISTSPIHALYENVTSALTHWGRVTHIYVSILTIIGSDNGLSPGWRQAIIWTNVGILLIGPLGTNFSEIWIKIYTFSFRKMYLKMSSGKWRSFCLSLNVLKRQETQLFEITKAPHYWPSVQFHRLIPRAKGPVIRKTFPCRDVVMTDALCDINVGWLLGQNSSAPKHLSEPNNGQAC